MDPPLIHLASPLSSGPAAERVYYAVGRSLTAADFLRQGRYVAGRLSGLTPPVIGVLTGLGLSPERFDSPDGRTGLAAFTIGVGSGIARDGRVVRVTAPITIVWTDLVEAVSPTAAPADGAYLLLARTVEFDGIEGPPPDPVLRVDPDPLLDIRQDSFVEIWLSAPLGPLPAGFATPAGLASGLNTLIAGLTEASLGAAIGNGVPLAIILVQGGQAVALRQAAGRLPAELHPLDAMLLAQVRETFAEALSEAGADPSSPAWQQMLRDRLRVLPAAGELPVAMLRSPAATTANCPFFPSGMAVYLQFIRASQAPHLLRRALGRPRLDLTNDGEEAVTLSLAVPDAAWTPDLLDIPRGDPALAGDLHLAYARARAAEVVLRQSWVALYGGIRATLAAQHQPIGFLIASDTAAEDISFLFNTGRIGLSDLLTAADTAASPADLLGWTAARITTLTTAGVTPPAALPPTTADGVTQQFTALGYQIVDPEPAEADPAISDHAPPASDTILQPLAHALPERSDFTSWTAAISAASPDPQILQPLIDAGIVGAGADAASRTGAINALLAVPLSDDTQPGALLALAILQLFHAVFVRIARAHEHVLDAHGRMIALQRQHLDLMSTYVSALAGGVPSDGSGLSFTRIIPFFDLHAAPSAPAPTGGPPPTSGAPIRAMTAFRPSLLSGSAALAPVAAAPAIAPTRVSAATFSLPSVDSAVRTITANGSPDTAPARSTIGSRIGTSADIARTVATDTSALSQAPPFAYQPVQYGAAAHITSGATLRQIVDSGLSGLRDLMTRGLNLTPAPLPTPTPTPTATGGLDDETASYASIAASTRALLGDIAQVETSAIRIEREYFAFRDRIQSLEARISQLTSAMARARDALRNAQAAAARTAGDYAAAQHLVQEEINRVAAATAARDQAIAAATGLFYERELQTVVARDLAPALTLVTETPTDLVPGCPADHAGPPAALQPFLDLLLEVPLGDWSSLLDAWTGLPDHAGLQRLAAQRTVRLTNRTLPATSGAGAAAADLASLAHLTQSSFEPLFRSALPASASLAEAQKAAFAVLALPDIVTLPVSLLRSRAEALRSRMESAAGCLFETLSALPPSTRFELAALARGKALPLLDFAHWPLPAGLGDDNATTARRLAALVGWMAAQLHGASSAAAHTALGNLVAAAVMAAAYGDPDEAVTGTVATTGVVPRPGLPIRVVLNRPPPIGTMLNLLDETQRIVGAIRVDDHDAQGTTATVVTSFARTAATGSWSVATPSGRAPWLPS